MCDTFQQSLPEVQVRGKLEVGFENSECCGWWLQAVCCVGAQLWLNARVDARLRKNPNLRKIIKNKKLTWGSDIEKMDKIYFLVVIELKEYRTC